ncbi:arabinose efflux permease family protein [Leptolyngbya sp. Heron Island J]|uniref:MFS transporter n=1 Tax=Leptolyngbya sp. Heron Island J TaxID=1385935 RepID=UPI0003B93FF1|nr:MFS transporter [Leptolyngbya sp. Heron Island J]ESA36784.1 arabinose efflux permease family protein [Leptolyngbya sp. Heron Island J]
MLRESDSSESKISEAFGNSPEAATVGTVELSDDIATTPPSQVTDSEPVTGFWPVLQNRNFLTLWGGQVFSQLADKVYLVLMIAIIASQYEVPGQTISGWVSAVMIAFTIPAVLFGSLAGVYVDRWLKQPVLVLTNVLRGVLVILLPLGLWLSHDLGNLAGVPVSFCLLLLVTFLVSTLTQFFAPAEQSAIPLIVNDQHLLSANSLYTTTMMASVIIGFAVGEPLLAIADQLLAPFDHGSGIGKDILVGLSYCLAGLILMLMRTHESPENLTRDSHVWTDIKDGFSYIKQQPPIRNAIIQLVLLFSVFAALAVLSVRLAEVIPTLKSSQFGILLAASGVGMGIGATLIGHFGHRFARRRLSLLGLVGMGASLGTLSMTIHSLWGSLALIALLGIFAATVGIPMQTTVQEQTPEDMRGKVFGLQNNVVNIALSLPLALAGVAEAFLGLRLVLLGLAVIVILGGLLTQTVFTVTTAPSSQSQD